MNKEYENIMNRLSSLANENGMVSLDAVAEVVNQELDVHCIQVQMNNSNKLNVTEVRNEQIYCKSIGCSR